MTTAIAPKPGDKVRVSVDSTVDAWGYYTGKGFIFKTVEVIEKAVEPFRAGDIAQGFSKWIRDAAGVWTSPSAPGFTMSDREIRTDGDPIIGNVYDLLTDKGKADKLDAMQTAIQAWINRTGIIPGNKWDVYKEWLEIKNILSKSK